VGVLGVVLASRTQTALDAALAGVPAVKNALDADFMSRLLAGDSAHGTLSLAPDARNVLAIAAPASFASGFASALCVAGVVAVVIAVTVWALAGRRQSAAARTLGQR